MKLISESREEDLILLRLSQLLQNIGLDVVGYRTEDALAATLWSSEDLMVVPEAMGMTSKEREEFMRSIEYSLQSAIITAGYETIANEFNVYSQQQTAPRHG